MSEQPSNSDADRKRGSIKEAIGKITGDRQSVREGAVEKTAACPEAPKAS